MLLRIVFVVGLFLLFVVPIYHILKKRTIKVKTELENDAMDATHRLIELKQKTKQLKQDCKQEEQSAKQRANTARKVRNKL